MPAPVPYARAFSFTDYTANHPSAQQPGVSLDNEFNAVAASITSVNARLALVQRADGRLANNSVGPEQVSLELTLGLRSVSDWGTGRAYVANDAVWASAKLYRCLLAHTSAAAFATDLAAGKWSLILDVQPYVPTAVNAAIAAGQITVGVDTSTFAGKGSTNVFTGGNTFQAATTFSALPTTSINTAVTAADYGAWKPTDYGAGKPGVFLRKKATAGLWALEVDDGVGGGGILDLPATATLGGATPALASQVTSLSTSIRRARNAGLTRR